jgi:hypothetical protein
VSLLLSGVLGLAAAPIAMRIGYPVFVDFGDGETLSRFAAAAPAPFLFGLLQVSLPTLALVSPLGFHYLLRNAGSTVLLGVVLNSLGLVFTTIQDGIEITLLYYLPRAYVAADEAVRPALLALGDFGGTAMGVFGRLGGVAFVGMVLINLAMWTYGGRWKFVAGLGIAAGAVILTAATLPAVSRELSFLEIGFPIGFIALRIWMIAAALIMIRWAPEHGAASEPMILH